MNANLEQAALELACEQWCLDHPDGGDGLHTVNLAPLPEGAHWWDITQARGRLAIKAQRQKLGTAAYEAAMRSFRDQGIRPEATPTESMVTVEYPPADEPAGERAPSYPSRVILDRPRVAWGLIWQLIVGCGLGLAVLYAGMVWTGFLK